MDSERDYEEEVQSVKYEMEIERLEGLVPRWLPVAERLPQDDDRYLVVRDSETMLVAYWGGGIFHYPNDTEVSEVTHWMPLPEPPTG